MQQAQKDWSICCSCIMGGLRAHDDRSHCSDLHAPDLGFQCGSYRISNPKPTLFCSPYSSSVQDRETTCITFIPCIHTCTREKMRSTQIPLLAHAPMALPCTAGGSLPTLAASAGLARVSGCRSKVQGLGFVKFTLEWTSRCKTKLTSGMA